MQELCMVLNKMQYGWIYLNVMNMFEYVWIYDNRQDSEYVSYNT